MQQPWLSLGSVGCVLLGVGAGTDPGPGRKGKQAGDVGDG